MTLKKLHSLVSVALISGALCLSAAPAQADSLFGISDRDRLNSMESVGSPFTRALAAEYRALSNFEYNDMYDHSDGNLFAQKGVQAALGNVVIPEKPDNWRLSPGDEGLFAEARARLMRALNNGARERMPIEAARAQASYDCWIEQKEESTQPGHIASCQQKYAQLMNMLEQGLDQKRQSIENAPVIAAGLQANYTVFFGTGKSSLSPAAQNTLNVAINNIRNNQARMIMVTGFTDTSGSKAANERLANRRVASVRDFLIKQGVPAQNIQTNALGENNLKVQTADGVSEAANRRVEISFQ